jgi:hypothetical protein
MNRVRWPKDGRQELQAGGGGPRYQQRLKHHQQHSPGSRYLPKGSIERDGIGAIETFWFVFWRMALWGLMLGLGLGAAYGTLAGLPFYPFGLVFGPLLGAMYGTIAGLPLGLLGGVVLGVVTVLMHRGGAPGDSLRYRRAAQLACVVACILAVALFWGVTFWRDPDPAAGVRLAFTRDLLETLIFEAGPLLVATGATWFAARRVAGQYARETAAEAPLRHH